LRHWGCALNGAFISRGAYIASIGTFIYMHIMRDTAVSVPQERTEHMKVFDLSAVESSLPEELPSTQVASQ
jgi:hypothetical protein